jgi:hypothetical protein
VEIIIGMMAAVACSYTMCCLYMSLEMYEWEDEDKWT